MALHAISALAAEPCGPVAHPLFQLCGPGPPTFWVPFSFFLLVTTEVGHVGGLPPTCIKYKCRRNLKSEKKKCVGVGGTPTRGDSPPPPRKKKCVGVPPPPERKKMCRSPPPPPPAHQLFKAWPTHFSNRSTAPVSVSLMRCNNEALTKLYFKSIIKCFERVKIDKWPDFSP